jgi:ABC-type thiamine transport system substrate-binding protein
VVDETDADAAALGIVMPEQPREDFELLEENWPVVEMFLRCQTQWRTTMSGVLGLDYGAVAWLFKMYAVEDPRALLEDLQVMEAAAMMVINSRSS